MAHLISHEECYLCEGDKSYRGIDCFMCGGTGWGVQFHDKEVFVAWKPTFIESGPALTETYIAPEELTMLLAQAFTVIPTTSHTGGEHDFTKSQEILASIYESISCFDCMDSGYQDGEVALEYCHCSAGDGARELQNRETQARAERHLHWVTTGEELA